MPTNSGGKKKAAMKAPQTPARRSNRLTQAIESSPLTSLPSQTAGGRTPKRATKAALTSMKSSGNVATVPKHVNWASPIREKPARSTLRNVIITPGESTRTEDDSDSTDNNRDGREDQDVLQLLDNEARQEINESRTDNDYEGSDYQEMSFQATLHQLNNEDSPQAKRGFRSARGYTRSSSVPAQPVTPTPSKMKRRAASQQGSPAPEDDEPIQDEAADNTFTSIGKVFPVIEPVSTSTAANMWGNYHGMGLPLETFYKGALAQQKHLTGSDGNHRNGGEPSMFGRSGRASTSRDSQPVTNKSTFHRPRQSNASTSRDSQSVTNTSTSHRPGQSKASTSRDSQSVTNASTSHRSGQFKDGTSRDSQPVPNSHRPGQSKASTSRDSQSVTNASTSHRSGQSKDGTSRDSQPVPNSHRPGQSKASTSRDSQPVTKVSASNRSERSNSHGPQHGQVVHYQPRGSESPPPSRGLHKSGTSKKRAVSPRRSVDINDERQFKRRKIPDAQALQLARQRQGDCSDEGEEVQQARYGDGDGSNDEGGLIEFQGARAVKEARPSNLKFYDAVTGIILKDARRRFVRYLALDDAYPCGKGLDDSISDAFDAARKKYPAEYERSTVREVNRSIRTMLMEAGHEFRGRVHTAAKDIIIQSYNLVPSNGRPVSRRVVAEIVEGLLANHGYVMGLYVTTKGEKIESEFYCHPAIQAVILRVFFRSRPTGTLLRKLCPIPFQLIAFVCAALKCALDEWATGSYVKIHFTQVAYRETYVWHRAWWQHLEAEIPNTLYNISKNMSDSCLSMAGMNGGGDNDIEAETEDLLAEFNENEPNIPGWNLRKDDDVMDD